MATILLGIVVPTATFIRPAALDDQQHWPFSRRARHAWAFAWLGIVFGVVFFCAETLRITKAFNAPGHRLNEALAGAYGLLFVVFVTVHVLPLLSLVQGGRRRLFVCVLAWATIILGGAFGVRWADMLLTEEPSTSASAVLILMTVVPVGGFSVLYAGRLVDVQSESSAEDIGAVATQLAPDEKNNEAPAMAKSPRPAPVPKRRGRGRGGRKKH